MNQVVELIRPKAYPWLNKNQADPSRVISRVITSLPEGCVVLGMGYDRFPVQFNLFDPTPGAILIAGEDGCGKTRLIQSILRSAGTLNDGRVSISMIANENYHGSHFGVTDMALDHCRPYTPDAAHMITTLYLLARKRLSKENKLPFIMLAIDDLGCLIGENERLVHAELVWLLKNGPSAGIWPVCTITIGTADSRQIQMDVIESFGTCLWGHIRTPATVFGLDASDAAPLSCLTPGREFCLRLDSGWLCFHIIDPSRTAMDELHPPLSFPNKVVNATRGGHHEYWHVMV